MSELLPWIEIALLAAVLVLLLRPRPAPQPDRAEADRLARLEACVERTERLLRDELREAREEQTRTQTQVGEALNATLRERLGQTAQQLGQVSEQTEKRLETVRATLEAGLGKLVTTNEAKLEQMRATVDEKLQSTLEKRLTDSFGLVSDRLEKVQTGLGEMRELATGVGDLKRVLTNVKNRGGWAEIQLGWLLEQTLGVDQYKANVRVRPDCKELVEFAICLPGDDENVWLPIDAKFPKEDYERLTDAYERADPEAIDKHGRALEAAIRTEARKICDKYVAPPHTTNFAIMYLPTEGLFAEIVRRPGLVDEIQTKCRVTIAGPTTFTALLNSLQMGFRTLAIQQRSGEVWKVLGGTKTEFEKLSGLWDKMGDQLNTVQKTVERVGTATKRIHKQLGKVETIEIETTSVAALLTEDDREAAE